MRQKLMRFMYGRYGVDQFSRSMSVVALVFIILGIFTRSRIVHWIPVILLGIVYFRMLSRNVNKRYQENMRYMVFHNKMMAKVNGWREAFACRKTHRVFACPGCGQKVRVPKGRGKVKVHCPKCNTSFIKKS